MGAFDWLPCCGPRRKVDGDHESVRRLILSSLSLCGLADLFFDTQTTKTGFEHRLH